MAIIFGTRNNDLISTTFISPGVTGGRSTNFADIINGLFGNDTIHGGGGADVINGNGGNDTIFGDGGDDNIAGSSGSDLINGGAGNDSIIGGSGNDLINGDAGDDIIIGSGGADIMLGRTGNDIYRYFDTIESGVGARDVITDFSHAVDKIQLSAIDANITLPGNQSFVFNGLAPINGGGEVNYIVSNDNIIIQAEIEGDGNLSIDMQIELLGAASVSGLLTSTDFIL